MMSGFPDELLVGCLSVENWQGLQQALGKLRGKLTLPEQPETASAGEVMAVLEDAGAPNPAVLWGALTRHFRVVKIAAR